MSVQSSNPFSGGIIAAMIGVGLLAFIAVFALIGWAPELASKNRAGQSAYSNSAIGYGGLVKLLEADGQDVSISRLNSTVRYAPGFLIITVPPNGFSRAEDFDIDEVSEPVLYVLPKWYGRVDRQKRNWYDDTELMNRSAVERVADEFDEDIKIWRLRNPGTLDTSFGEHRPNFGQKMQVIESEILDPLIKTAGGILLARVPDAEVYILSDPDLLNTFGLAKRENAAFGLGLIDWLNEYDQPIILDATVHGFARDENLLKLIFDVPFVGATLLAIATALLIGWAAFVRFGPPQREARTIAYGKRALADSSAGLISMGRREGKMAPSYLRLTRRLLMRSLKLPAKLPAAALDTLLNRLAKQKKLDQTWSDHTARLSSSARNRDDLRDKAAALWRWRKDISDGDE